MNEQDVKSIALFFFFSSLDEKKSVELTRKSIKKINKLLAQDVTLKKEVTMIAVTYAIWTQATKSSKHVFGAVPPSESAWKFPKGITLTAWKQFLKEELPQNIFVVIWTRILGFSEVAVSAGLSISQGTLQTRSAHALRRLGEYSAVEIAHA